MKYLFLAIVLVACTKTETNTVTVTETKTETKTDTTNKVIATGWFYDDFVTSQLTPKLLLSNPGTLCPKWKKEMGPKFWLAFVKATAFRESSFNPKSQYVEKFTDDKGNPQVSQGLMQLSLDDTKKKTPWCLKLTPTTILEPETNLGCAIEIMNWLVDSRPTLQESLGRYWSVIRNGKVLPDLKTSMPECF